jgi:putative addiction module killer protein
VESEPVQVQLYIAQNGRTPFEEWLKRLKDRQARAKIQTRIIRLRLGNMGDAKAVGEGVQELRIDYGPGYRLYFGQGGSTTVLLLCGGDKGTQAADIKKAKEYWADYQQRRKASDPL